MVTAIWVTDVTTKEVLAYARLGFLHIACDVGVDSTYLLSTEPVYLDEADIEGDMYSTIGLHEIHGGKVLLHIVPTPNIED
jgi:hypothetical protein